MSSFASRRAAEAEVPVVLRQSHERLGQAGDGGRFPQGGHAIRRGRPVEEAEQFQERHLATRFLAVVLHPLHIGLHRPEGVAALDLRIRFLEADAVAAADVAVEGPREEVSEDLQGQRMAVHVFHQLLELGLRTGSHADGAEQLYPGGRREARQLVHGRGGLPVGAQVGEGIPGGDDAKPQAGGGQPFEQGGEALVLELARRGRGGRVLQGLHAIEDEQRPPLADELGQPPAFVERALRAARHRRVAEEGEGFRQKRVGRNGGLLARALAVEGPRENGIAPRPVLMRQLRRPLRDQRGLPLATEGDEGEDMGALRLPAHDLVPGRGEELGLRLAADQFLRGVFDDAGEVGLEGR